MKWCSLMNCNWCVSLDIAYIFALSIIKYYYYPVNNINLELQWSQAGLEILHPCCLIVCRPVHQAMLYWQQQQETPVPDGYRSSHLTTSQHSWIRHWQVTQSLTESHCPSRHKLYPQIGPTLAIHADKFSCALTQYAIYHHFLIHAYFLNRHRDSGN